VLRKYENEITGGGVVKGDYKKTLLVIRSDTGDRNRKCSQGAPIQTPRRKKENRMERMLWGMTLQASARLVERRE